VATFFGATFLVYALMFANQDDPLQALAGDRPISDAQRQILTERYHLNATRSSSSTPTTCRACSPATSAPR
jgi:ABC-type dipeptide/oligopeptide/nickel transport system permease component